MSDHLIAPLHESGVVPVIRTRSAERANRAVEWLNDAGFRTFELMASINGIVELVEELSGNVELDIGVGMVGRRAGTGLHRGRGELYRDPRPGGRRGGALPRSGSCVSARCIDPE